WAVDTGEGDLAVRLLAPLARYGLPSLRVIAGWAEAVVDMQNAESSPFFPAVLPLAGYAAMERGDSEQAVDFAERALDLALSRSALVRSWTAYLANTVLSYCGRFEDAVRLSVEWAAVSQEAGDTA